MTAPTFDTSYTALPSLLFAHHTPAPAASPGVIKINDALAEVMGIDPAWLNSADGLAMLSGSSMPESAANIALAYAGHQFGNWVPQLGDGRAVLVGEIVGMDGQRRDIHLKGSGRTAYSRGGDGKAGIGPVVREYVLCEAMHALGIPTTRALAAVTTGDTVYRETPMPGAVFARVASSHLRVGTFQYVYARQDTAALKALADHAIARHASEAVGADNPYRALLERVIEKQAQLVAEWLGVGFIHGVMNTDNTTISGETIDYGPCAFMDAYNPRQVYSSIDQFGRYAYGNQPQTAQWNLAQLAQSLLPLLADDEDAAIKQAQEALDVFPKAFETAYVSGLRTKLGLATEDDGDFALAQDLLKTMTANNADFTLTFRRLARAESEEGEQSFLDLFDDPKSVGMWLTAWRSRLSKESLTLEERRAAMDVTNPIYIPRNHQVEKAIAASIDGDYGPFETLVSVLSDPYTERPDGKGFELPPEPSEEVLQTFCGT